MSALRSGGGTISILRRMWVEPGRIVGRASTNRTGSDFRGFDSNESAKIRRLAVSFEMESISSARRRTGDSIRVVRGSKLGRRGAILLR